MEFIARFENLGIKDVEKVGGKNASLGEMIQRLSEAGVSVPGGFAVTAQAYWHHINTNNLRGKIEELIGGIDKNDLADFSSRAQAIRTCITQAPMPEDLEVAISQAYRAMEDKYTTDVSVAVRSSATAEDLPTASFAGQQETYLNVCGAKALCTAAKKSFASLFTDRAISYRIDHGFEHMSVALSVGVQKMVRSDKAAAGVMFTLDTESGHPDIIMINSSYGLGESVVKGEVNPDEFFVHKPSLEKGFRPLLKKRLGSKKTQTVFDEKEGGTKTIPVPDDKQHLNSLSDDEILQLARFGSAIEQHYSTEYGRRLPMDIEWAKDGDDGQLYIVQARPETVHSQNESINVVQTFTFDVQPDDADLLARGKSVGAQIVSGIARVIDNPSTMNELQPGEILIADMTDPDWEPIMKRAGGIITNRGGRTCHAAIVSRELGIPAIVGAVGATKKIKTGQEITLDCAGSEVGFIYQGMIPFTLTTTEVDSLPELTTELMANVGNPDQSFAAAQLPCKGVGLARLEFIINSAIKIHPMALVQPEKVTDEKMRLEIEKLTAGYEDKKQYFIDTLAQEAGTIVAAFYPRPVIVRLSDFKSNEYRQLIGGKYFEPDEQNPMIGFRGASRYYDDKYKDAFELECLAMKKIRYRMGLDNLKVMVPFVRTAEEGKKVVEIIRSNGLPTGSEGVEVYMMVEIPSNVICIDEFAEIFDGFSIGSNDLTQLTLAVDRDSGLVAHLFDERDLAVKKMLALALQGAQQHQKPIGICGQAPSDFPELAKWLVEKGINTMSLTPDTVIKTWLSLGE